MRWVVGYGLYLVLDPHTPVRPPASTRYNPYPTSAYLITNSFMCLHKSFLTMSLEVTMKQLELPPSCLYKCGNEPHGDFIHENIKNAITVFPIKEEFTIFL